MTAAPEAGTGATEGAPTAAETGHDLRLVPAAVALWALAAWAVAEPVGVVVVAAVAVAVLAAVVVAILAAGRRDQRDPRDLRDLRDLRDQRGRPGRRRRREQTLAAAVVLVAAPLVAMLAVQARAASVRDAEPVHGWAAAGAVARIEAVATGDAHRLRPGPFGGPPRYLVTLSTRSVEARGLRATVRAPVLVLAGGAWAAVSAGERVAFTGRLGAADRAEGVAAAVTALSAPRVTPGGLVWRAADRVRAGLRRACAGLGEDSRGLLPALVVGDTSALPPGLVEDLRSAGLTHLTAVSGANVTIVAVSAVWLVSVVGAGRSARVWLALTAVAAFVVLARPQPSVLRAAVMGAIGLVALLGARRARGIPLLAAAAIVLLVLSPGLSRSAGFALSVTATAALVLLAPAWAARLERWLPRPAALAVAVPAAAQAACGPIVVALNPSVSTTAVPANLLAGPAVAPATLLGVVAALLSLLWPWGAAAVAHLGGLATWWISAVAHRAAAVPGGSLPWPSGARGALLLAAVTAVVVVASLRVGPVEHDDDSAASPERRQTRHPETGSASAATVLVAAATVVALAVGWLAAPWLLRALHGRATADWAVAMCDVGQGDMLAARSGPDAAVLVDVGPDPDAADRCLRSLGVRRVDLVVLTHFHADHVDGLAGVLRHGRPVAVALVSRLSEPAENARAVESLLAAAGTPEVEAAAGLAGEVGEGEWRVGWHVLHADRPAGTATSGGDGAEGTTVNEASIATEVVVTGPGGSLRVVGLGDLEADGQASLRRDLQSGRVPLGGPVDVVKVAHHGSATQDADLYRLLAAPTALIGVGADNDYGHPSPKTVAMLHGSRIGRTDRQGTVVLRLPFEDNDFAAPEAMPSMGTTPHAVRRIQS